MNKKGFAEINEGRIYFEILGAGPVIVLIHGFALDTRMWNSQVQEFSKDYTVVRYDLRGYGKSSLPNEPYSHIEDLRGLLEYLNITSCHLLGFSIGGVIAIDFTITFKHRVISFMVANTIPSGFQRLESPVTSSSDLKLAAQTLGIVSAKNKLLNHRIFSFARRIPDVESALLQMMESYSGWHWLNSDFNIQLSPPASLRLHEISVPTLIIASEYDGLDSQQAAEFLHERIKGSEIVKINSVGHFSSMEAPQEFNRTILNFLSREKI